MPTTPPASRVLVAAVTGAATTAYYATPDLIRSRPARGWAKAGLAAVITAAAVPDLRKARADASARRVRREQEARRAATTSEPAEEPIEEPIGLRDALDSMPPRARVVLGATAAALVAGSVAMTVAGERWIFRRGEVRRAAGRSWPHTRAAVVWGLIAGGLLLVPDPPEPQDATGA